MSAQPAAEVTTRVATPADAGIIAEIHFEAFEGYRVWAPPNWSPPPPGEAMEAFLAEGLSRPDVWCLMAVAQGQAVGQVALSRFTMLDPEPAPTDTIYVWQLFVRPPWQGRGVATGLMREAVVEARRRGYTHMRLWTPRDAARARRFYEREGWTKTGRALDETPLGLPAVEYARAVGDALPPSSCNEVA